MLQDEIYGSAYAAAVYISSVIKLPKEKKVYVIGQAGLEEELRDEGVSFLGGTVPIIIFSSDRFFEADLLKMLFSVSFLVF